MSDMKLRHLQALFDASLDAILIADDQGHYVAANSAASDLLGIPREELLQHQIADFLEPGLDFSKAWQSFQKHGRERGRIRLLRPDGQFCQVEYAATANFVPHLHLSILRPVDAVATPRQRVRERRKNKQKQRLNETAIAPSTKSTIAQLAERERLINTVTQNIRQSLDLNRILATIVEDVRTILQADRVLVFRFNPDWSGEMIAESVMPPWIRVVGSTVYDPCFVGDVVEDYKRGKINRINDVWTANLADCYVNLLNGLQIRANLAIPITVEDRLWGLLCVNFCGVPHVWQEWEIELLKRLAETLAIAIYQAGLHEQVRQLNLDLEQQVQARTAELQQALVLERTLKSITDQVRDSLDEQKILQTAVQELGRALQIDGCDVAFYNDERTASTITYEYTVSLTPALGKTIRFDERPQVYNQLLQGNHQQFCFRTDDADSHLRVTSRSAAILCYPLIEDQVVIGDMWFYRPNDEIFHPVEMRLIEQVASQCVIALRQARLFEAAHTQVKELERLHQLKDDFLSTISHELRSPMTNIKMATDLIGRSLTQLSPLLPEALQSADSPIHGITRYFHILKEEGRREIALINDLLDLARLDADAEPHDPSTITLQDWVPPYLEAFLRRTQEQDQILEFDLPPDLPSLVTDASHLQRIVVELMNNACKYTPAHETICISAQAVATQMELRISNTGVEIPPEECDRIFDRFYRIPSNDPWKHGGTGLGLALVKKLVEYLDGTIAVKSGHGQTQFILQFPLNPVSADECCCQQDPRYPSCEHKDPIHPYG